MNQVEDANLFSMLNKLRKSYDSLDVRIIFDEETKESGELFFELWSSSYRVLFRPERMMNDAF